MSRYQILLKLRELRRDVLYELYGDEKWREHDTGNFWDEAASDDEELILKILGST